MKALFILLTCLFVPGTQMNGFTVWVNNETHCPDSVIYTTLPHVRAVKRLAEFHGNPNLERDFKGSGFDIGHNANAEDMDYSQASEFDSFNFNQVYAQRPNCNRVTWLAIENYVRGLGVSVRVKDSYNGVWGKIGIDSVVVPLYCIKELWYAGKYEKYSVPNLDTCIRHNFAYYRVK